MSRISECFVKLQNESKKALIPFITAGDPCKELSLQLLHQLVRDGADMIELGVPFSDPMADGPAIQKASERALDKGMDLQGVLDIVREFRQINSTTPVILMGYLNPFESMGYANFAKAASDAGVDGVLTVDLPPEESSEFLTQVKSNDIDSIFLLAPTTDPKRVPLICSQSSGYVYYVSIKGVTGATTLNPEWVAEKVHGVKAHTDLPVCVGFGIKDGESARAVAEVSDGVIIGSAIVRCIENNVDSHDIILENISQLICEVRSAIDNV